MYKATYSPVAIPQRTGGGTDSQELMRGPEKAAFVRSLEIAQPEADELRERGTAPAGVLDALTPSTTPLPARLGPVPTPDLVQLATALAELRKDAAEQLRSPAPTGFAATLTAAAPTETPAETESRAATALTRAAFAEQAAVDFAKRVAITPVGRLHLERIDMTPAGTERGELLSTIPLSPKETVNVVHKEWSTITDTFESVVKDELESYSEKGVTEKTELSQSAESQTKVANALDLSAHVSGSYGFVTFSTDSSFKHEENESTTRRESSNHSMELTQKASLRAKKEHKVTISTVSVVGKEETSTRTLTNPSATQAMRVDYYSLIRKWRVQLYRYGLRMTYDLVLPDVGAGFRRTYTRLRRIDTELAKSFVFDLDPENITEEKRKQLQTQYHVILEPEPDLQQEVRTTPQHYEFGDNDGVHTAVVDFEIPDGYAVSKTHILAELGNFNKSGRMFMLLGFTGNLARDGVAFLDEDLTAPAFNGMRGKQNFLFTSRLIDQLSLTLRFTVNRTDEHKYAWQLACWEKLREAALTMYNAHRRRLEEERTALYATLSGTDTLTLRQEEHEEIMRVVLGWLFGPGFDLMPSDVHDLYRPTPAGDLLEIGEPSGLPGAEADKLKEWKLALHYGEVVKFLHQAIEWENVLYFLYPYFWDPKENWDSVRSMNHPDPTRQSFLRSGAARVVLTIRPGYEESFAALMENGAFSDELPPDHPYMTIAQELRAYALRTYPGIPAANPGGGPIADDKLRGVLVNEWYQYTPTSGVDIGIVMHDPE
ncbi:hypothetical protein [Streptomyces cyaneus]|uniref:hypothetical protein n=1 Tax=Streptomyces cyaneus TaxID=1904 RepID=UPI000FF88B59|nr:hypothetical protein [Streptomyces cyaneus]